MFLGSAPVLELNKILQLPSAKKTTQYTNRFKTHDSETIYKVKNSSDTFDSIVVRPAHLSRPSASGT
jgi:hypothetical protein